MIPRKYHLLHYQTSLGNINLAPDFRNTSGYQSRDFNTSGYQSRDFNTSGYQSRDKKLRDTIPYTLGYFVLIINILGYKSRYLNTVGYKSQYYVIPVPILKHLVIPISILDISGFQFGIVYGTFYQSHLKVYCPSFQH